MAEGSVDRNPAGWAGTFLVDAHVHCHPGVDHARFLDAAAHAFAAAAREAGITATAGVLMFTEVAGAQAFERLRAGGGLPGWQLEPTQEETSLIAQRHDAPSSTPPPLVLPPLILVAGRQIVTAEGLEVLALGAAGPFAERESLEATLAAVRAADGVAVLPWGFGKWWGRRGRAVDRVIEQAEQGTIFLGDNGGRAALLPTPPRFTKAAARGIRILPGSDALPLAVEATKVGTYGFMLRGRLDRERPAADIKRLMRELDHQPRSFGRLQPMLPFVGRQLAMQWRNRKAVR